MRAVVLLAMVLVPFMVGLQVGGEPEVEYRTETVTETVTETQTVEVPTTPAECVAMVDNAREIQRAGKRYDVTVSDLLDIMSDLRIAVATGDSNAANDLETELRNLSSKTVGAAETLGETDSPFDIAADECLAGAQ